MAERSTVLVTGAASGIGRAADLDACSRTGFRQGGTLLFHVARPQVASHRADGAASNGTLADVVLCHGAQHGAGSSPDDRALARALLALGHVGATGRDDAGQ